MIPAILQEASRSAYRCARRRGACPFDSDDAAQSAALLLLQRPELAQRHSARSIGAIVGFRHAIDLRRSELPRIDHAMPAPADRPDSDRPIFHYLTRELGETAALALQAIADGATSAATFGGNGSTSRWRKAQLIERARIVLDGRVA